MSYHDYRAGLEISLLDFPFYAVVMAAMRQADTMNLALLQVAFPEVWTELEARYRAPGGILAGESLPQEP